MFWKRSWVLYSYLIKSRFSIPKTIYLNYFLEIFFFNETHKSSIFHTISHSLVSQIIYTDEAILWFLMNKWELKDWLTNEPLIVKWKSYIVNYISLISEFVYERRVSIRKVYWDMIKCYHCFIHRLYIIKRSFESMGMKVGIQK